MPLTIQLRPSESQTAFNLKRWRQLLADPELVRLPYRVETDRHGHILMSPPSAPAHGKKQNRIGTLLEQFLPNGHVVTECPALRPSTSHGSRRNAARKRIPRLASLGHRKFASRYSLLPIPPERST